MVYCASAELVLDGVGILRVRLRAYVVVLVLLGGYLCAWERVCVRARMRVSGLRYQPIEALEVFDEGLLMSTDAAPRQLERTALSCASMHEGRHEGTQAPAVWGCRRRCCV